MSVSGGAGVMAEEGGRARLGRGLAALIAESSDQMPMAAEARDRRRIRTADLRPNPRNPRRRFGEDELDELANSVREKGVIQPIVVRPAVGQAGVYEIIAGERRWRAALAANLDEVPVVVLDVGDKEALELAIIENVQRADLNAIEEARGYEQLARDFAYSQTDLARLIGKSRSHVANTLRLLKLPPAIEAMVVEGALTAGHARALLAFDDPEPVARRILARGLNVRDVERLAQGRSRRPVETKPTPPLPKRASPTQEARALSARLGDLLGLAVDIDPQGAGGEIRIRYATRDELESLCRQLGGG